MRLAIDPLVHPIGSTDWQSRASLASVRPLKGVSRANIEGYHLKSWKWARSSSQAALELAAEYDAAGDTDRGDEARRVANRHNGVWRAANKLIRTDERGRETRAIVAVRSDAGDSTCPTFLERQGRKRSAEMWPIVHACRTLGYTIASAASPPIKRERFAEAIAFLADKHWRELHEIAGLDVIVVPQADGMVIAYVLAAFRGAVHSIQLPTQFEFTPIIDIERIYDEPTCAALNMGPALWIRCQVQRYNDGRRSRDRLTYGCFYGKASEQVIIDAAKLDELKITPTAAKILAEVESKIDQSIELTNRCVAAGDLEAARAAYGYVGAYLFDAAVDLPEYGLQIESLKFRSRVDFTGLSEAPAMGSIHDLLMTEIRSLPAPKPYSLPQWRCIELVSVHSIDDIQRLIDWVREA